jgi:hypothetical protein
MLKYFLLWFPMLLIALANGALRDLVYKRYAGELTAHQVSTFVLILLFAFYIGYVLQRFPPSSDTQAIIVGFLWLALTLAFEFGFGRWRGNSWSKLLEDYNLFEGRLWVLVPFWILIAPYLFYKLAK